MFPDFTMTLGSKLIERHRNKKAMASNLHLGRCSGRKTVSLIEINIKNQHIYPTTKFSHPGFVGKAPIKNFIAHSIIGLINNTPFSAPINIKSNGEKTHLAR
jgi:hypothetical protein